MAGRPVRTFLDSGVLLTAFNGVPHLRERALRVLEDRQRVFLSSPFVRHEVLCSTAGSWSTGSTASIPSAR